MGLWVIARKLLWDYGMMGWPSLFAAVVILGGMQLIATSVIGEYIARIYVQAQARPLYNVAERLNFDVIQAQDELQRVSVAAVPAPPAPASEPADRPSGPVSARGVGVRAAVLVRIRAPSRASRAIDASPSRKARLRDPPRRRRLRLPAALAGAGREAPGRLRRRSGREPAGRRGPALQRVLRGLDERRRRPVRRRAARGRPRGDDDRQRGVAQGDRAGRRPSRPAVLRRPGDGPPLPGEGRDARRVPGRGPRRSRSSRAATASKTRWRSRARAGSRWSSSRRAAGVSAASRA